MTNKYQNCHLPVYSKFYRLRFCQILFELVYSFESYRQNNNGELTFETQRSLDRYTGHRITECYNRALSRVATGEGHTLLT